MIWFDCVTTNLYKLYFMELLTLCVDIKRVGKRQFENGTSGRKVERGMKLKKGRMCWGRENTCV